MLDCWKVDAEERPAFAQLISTLEEMMTEDNPYFDINKINEDEPCYSDVVRSTSEIIEFNSKL